MSTTLTFTINSHDYKGIVTSNSYKTTLDPVTISRTDLDGVDHVLVVRHRGGVKVNINPCDVATRTQLCNDLMAAPVSVTYHSFQRGIDVTETMVPKWAELLMAVSRTDGMWVQAAPLELTQV